VNEKKAELYIICFPNWKLYVGITTKTAEQRFKVHVRGAHKGGKGAVHKALHKYGPKNCRLVVLHKGLSWIEACELEQYYIKELQTRTFQSGYNLTDGAEGSSGMVQSEKCRQIMRRVHLGKPKSEEQKQHMKEANRLRWQNPIFREQLLVVARVNQIKAAEAVRGKKLIGSVLERIQANVAKAHEANRKKHRERYNYEVKSEHGFALASV
jgi:group I intron endonuclease